MNVTDNFNSTLSDNLTFQDVITIQLHTGIELIKYIIFNFYF